MIENFPFYLSLTIAVVLLIMLANKIKVAYPVLLVLAGLGICFIPGIPVIHIDPDLIFIIFLPPLLYEAAWNISWKELWHWRRIILSFAFVVVFLTAMSVALVANHFIPGISLALGFLLGGIVSPPDAVSAGSILKFVKVPKRISSILEGESLLNDASSLIIFRFALIAVATGQFIWQEAALSFGWMLVGGIGIGVGVDWLFMKAHRLLPTDANMDIIMTILSPYLMYITAEELHSSGVLAVVSGGLLLANNQHRFLSSRSRLRSVNVWESFCFLLNGLVFILIGLALPDIAEGLQSEGVSLYAAIGYGILVTAVLVIGRIISAYGAVIVTLIARNFITVADTRHPGYKVPLVLGWTGMRGVVSLAAALSIPAQLDNGQLFPQRNLILFITFMVILLTLLVQGLTLPYLIKKLLKPNVREEQPEDEIYHHLGKILADHALAHLQSNYANQLNNEPVLQKLAQKWGDISVMAQDTVMTEKCRTIYLDVIAQQRQWLLAKNRADPTLNEDVVKRHLQHLDLEEEKLLYL